MQLDNLSIKSMLIALLGVAKEFGLHKDKAGCYHAEFLWDLTSVHLLRHPNKLSTVIVRFQSHAWTV